MSKTDTTQLYDVVAIDIATGAKRIMATGKTEGNAEAIIRMAVMRRGVGPEFFDTVPAGSTE